MGHHNANAGIQAPRNKAGAGDHFQNVFPCKGIDRGLATKEQKILHCV